MEKRNGPVTLAGERLVLRPWTDSDLAPHAILNDDAEVMEHMPRRLDRADSDAMAARIRDDLDTRGWGLWAADVDGVFIGWIGLNPVPFEAHFTPAIEVGWRLARPYWGHGYATEGARLAIAFAFAELGLDEIVSFTVPANLRSIAVMERLGMTHDPADDFDHPRLSETSPLLRHVLYRLPASAVSSQP